VCGIAGKLNYRDSDRPVDPDVLTAMTRSLAHRGPDGEGVWLDGGVGLGHRRLSIIDLSDHARQPMLSDDGRYVITYNGEVYNFRELRAELESRGRSFASHSDTEVILQGYAEWGEGVVDRISGIYAFGIYDTRLHTLFLARDPLGVKPLFYADHGGTFWFGSEVKAILTDSSVPRDHDGAALDSFLTLGYTPAPATGFAVIRQLPPGHCAKLRREGVLQTRRFWSCPYEPQPRAITFAEAVQEFTTLVDRVTAQQLVSDVPVGAFLSGGLDSAAIVRAMKRADMTEVHALTVGFQSKGFDERSAARRTAESLGVSLEEEVATLDAAALLPRLSRHMEEPTADSSMLPVYLLCQAARRRFTVAMSGDGADEILAGYDTYRATRLARHYRRIPGPVRRGLFAPLVRRIPISDRKYALHQVATRFVAGAEAGPGRDHASWRLILGDALKRRLYTRDFSARLNGNDPVGAYAATIREVPATRDALDGLLHADTAFYLPNDMLIKVDRMSMAHGLEVRVPFLDVALVRYCANLPASFKLHRGRVRKHILRESLRGSIPDAVVDRPKSGFNIPVEQWMRGQLYELLMDAVRTRKQEMERFLRTDMIETIAGEHRRRAADHGHALFAILMFALWLDNAASAWRFEPRSQPAEMTAGESVPV